MKQIVFAGLAFAMLCVFSVFAQFTTNAPQVFSDRLHPATNSSNIQNIRSHQIAWANTSNTISTTWTATGSATNGWTLAGLNTNSSGQLYFFGLGSAWAGVSGVTIKPNSYARLISSITVPSTGLQGGYALLGILPGTNALFTNQNIGDSAQLRAFGVVNGGQTLAVWGAAASISHSPSTWGTTVVTNGTYPFCISFSPSNVCFAYVAPGHTNEYLIKSSRTNWFPAMTNNVTLGLLCPTAKTNGILFNRVGARGDGPDTLAPRNYIEGACDFVIWDVTAINDRFRLVIPSGYDAGTNVGNLLVNLHGNMGSEFDPFELQGDKAGVGGQTLPRDWYNGVVTNNFALASYGGSYDETGRADTWGTSNSLRTLDNVISTCRNYISFSNVFLIGESAGALTALNYAVAHKPNSGSNAIAGIILNHPVFSITNQWPGRVEDITNAFGGGTGPSVFAGYDPGTYPASTFAGIPMRIIASPQDLTVTKTNQSDLLVTLLGGVINGCATNTPYVPEIDDVSVSGDHGDISHYTNLLEDVKFLRRCISYQ